MMDDLIHAHWMLRRISTRTVTQWASEQLVLGREEKALVELASLYGDDSREVGELLNELRAQLARSPLSQRDALAIVAAQIATEIVLGSRRPAEGARDIHQLASREGANLDSKYIPFTGLVSEWDDDETHREQIDQAIVVSALHLASSANPTRPSP